MNPSPPLPPLLKAIPTPQKGKGKGKGHSRVPRVEVNTATVAASGRNGRLDSYPHRTGGPSEPLDSTHLRRCPQVRRELETLREAARVAEDGKEQAEAGLAALKDKKKRDLQVGAYVKKRYIRP